MEIKDFNLKEALNGGSIAFTSEGKVTQYILYFKEADNESLDLEYEGLGQDDNIYYYFDFEGNCKDDNPLHKLFKVTDKIEGKRGTEASRGDGSGGTETVNITMLQPRELLAQYALNAIIQKMNKDVLSLDDYAINNICELSFKIAQAMINKAAEKRAATQSKPENPDIDVDINTVNSTTDKILYNISNSMKLLSDNSTKIKDETLANTNNYLKTISENSTANKEIFGNLSTTMTTISGYAATNVSSLTSIKDAVVKMSNDGGGTKAIADKIDITNEKLTTLNNSSSHNSTVLDNISSTGLDTKAHVVSTPEPLYVEFRQPQNVRVVEQPVIVSIHDSSK